MNPIAVVAATHHEISVLAEHLSPARHLTRTPFPVLETVVGADRILLLVTGIGKVNAASALTWFLQHYSPRLVVVTGCAGAFPGCGLGVGDLAVATAEIYADEGVLTPAGWQDLSIVGIPMVEKNGTRYFNEFPLDRPLAEKALHRARALGLPLKAGTFLTVSTCSGTTARGEELKKRFDAISENMEGAACAQVAVIHGIDCLEVRGISNMVEDRDRSRWDIPGAVGQVQRFLLHLLPDL